MSKKAVEQLIGKMFMDPKFRKKARKDLDAAMAEFNLTATEQANFAKLNLGATDREIEKIWDRISHVMGTNLN